MHFVVRHYLVENRDGVVRFAGLIVDLPQPYHGRRIGCAGAFYSLFVFGDGHVVFLAQRSSGGEGLMRLRDVILFNRGPLIVGDLRVGLGRVFERFQSGLGVLIRSIQLLIQIEIVLAGAAWRYPRPA